MTDRARSLGRSSRNNAATVVLKFRRLCVIQAAARKGLRAVRRILELRSAARHDPGVSLNLLPFPRSVRRNSGTYRLPSSGVFHLPAYLPRDTLLLPLAERVTDAAADEGSELQLITGPVEHPHLCLKAVRGNRAPDHVEGYVLSISKQGITIEFREVPGLRAAVATLRQLLREHGRVLPCVSIRDQPDFPRRGVMLDVSRGRVPRLETLMELAGHLADWKINEFQLYVEHTFAYRNYEPVWRDWGALTAEEMMKLDAHCRSLGIDLVPNQNSFGHLRYWLEHPPLRHLAEVSEPYPAPDNSFLRYPTTLAPNHPVTIPFLRELYDELLPCFTSDRFNVGCDETWDLGRGQSRALCERRGKGRVYLDFLRKVHREVQARGRRMLFWGDIILHHPELLPELPRDVIALNWGYDRDHPFERECALFAGAKLPFYVCPGTSTWMTLIGRHDNAFPNLRRAAVIGRRHRATGYLNTDWGDGGHPQPLAVSYLPYLLGAAASWNARVTDDDLLLKVVNRDVFADPEEKMGRVALALGLAHRRFGYLEPNVTPFGAVVAAPKWGSRELFCRHGLKYFAVISARKVQDALDEVEEQRRVLYQARPLTKAGDILAAEMDMAARMAAESCHYMLWQQQVADGKTSSASRLAKRGIKHLRELEADFSDYWPFRNKATPVRCCPWLRWRREEYRSGRLVFNREEALAGLPRGGAPVLM